MLDLVLSNYEQSEIGAVGTYVTVASAILTFAGSVT
jgi:hypothetical protein